MIRKLSANLAAAFTIMLGTSALAQTPPAPGAILELPARFHPGSGVAAPDGRIFVASITTGRIMVFAPGSSTPTDFIDPAAVGMDSAMGIEVDTARNRLWACSANLGVDRTPGDHPTALLGLNLQSGALEQTLPLPGGGLCNDLVVTRSGALVVTDSFSPRLLVLRPGASALEDLIRDPLLTPPTGGFGTDGIIELDDGSLLVSKNSAGELVRINDPLGSTPTITPLRTSRALANADGIMRGLNGQIYLAEPDFTGRNGRIDRISLTESEAVIETVVEQLATPLGIVVTPTGFWTIEGRMGPVLFPDRKNEDPGRMTLVFHAE
ncbi:hypothetical protein I3J13_22890 [Agrobacterium sp. MOPV5]|uniref:hypothetical protein n=1 Tax=Agrobacterium leguminum TaxID=2792015 RepID=UPI0018C341FD|nr:hypothetical protein [Agrobacterium leguminum]MBG0511625.1 hypothetical protein [Agrobacterium leguminum]